mgnify:CR=1 FL=1
MKTLLSLAFSIFLFGSVNAQFFSALTERADKAKDRILLIEEGDFECSDDIASLVKKYWTIIPIKTAIQSLKNVKNTATHFPLTISASFFIDINRTKI